MRIEISKDAKSTRIDDGIRIQYSIYTILLLLIFISPFANLFRGYNDEIGYLYVIWTVTLVGAVIILFYMWFKTTTLSTIKLNEIKYVSVRK